MLTVEVLLYVHRNRRCIREGSPGRPPRPLLLSSEWRMRDPSGTHLLLWWMRDPSGTQSLLWRMRDPSGRHPPLWWMRDPSGIHPLLWRVRDPSGTHPLLWWMRDPSGLQSDVSRRPSLMVHIQGLREVRENEKRMRKVSSPILRNMVNGEKFKLQTRLRHQVELQS